MFARRLLARLGWMALASIIMCAWPLHAAPTKEEALKDWQDLVALYTSVKEKLDVYQSGYIYDKPEEQVEAFTAFEKNEMPKIKAMLESFGAKYGTSPGAIENTIFKMVGAGRLICAARARRTRTDLPEEKKPLSPRKLLLFSDLHASAAAASLCAHAARPAPAASLVSPPLSPATSSRLRAAPGSSSPPPSRSRSLL